MADDTGMLLGSTVAPDGWQQQPLRPWPQAPAPQLSEADLAQQAAEVAALRRRRQVAMPDAPRQLPAGEIANIAASMVPGAGFADVAGLMPDLEKGGTQPSLVENVKQGNLGAAAGQAVGGLGDALMVTAAGAPLGVPAKAGAAALKAASKTSAVAKAAKEAAIAAKEARTAGTVAREAPAVAEAAGAGDNLVEGIRAYHGSPHDFERFDLSKIGTGEGAQAYGHGLYFAENEGTAKSYRDNLAGYKFVQDAIANNTDKRPAQVAEWLYGDPHMSGEHLAGALKVLDPEASPAKIQEWITSGRELLATSKDAGRMYEVNIRADPAHFIDYDKPLAEQHPIVQKALGNVNPDENIAAPIRRAYQSPYHGGDFVGMPQASPDEVSRILAERGVPGIRYFDQGSRPDFARVRELRADAQRYAAQGEHEFAASANKLADDIENSGSRNYVLFNDQLIDILRKYGLAGAAPLGALMATGVQQSPEQ